MLDRCWFDRHLPLIRRIAAVFGISLGIGLGLPEVLAQQTDQETTEPDLDRARLELMRDRAGAIRFRANPGDVKGSNVKGKDLPERVQPEPLFRYDDIPRGYLDGAVWRWGQKGRPLAIITTELHPKYLGASPRIVYDFLSLSDFPFTALSSDASWRPSLSAVEMKPLVDGPKPATTVAQRRFQMKRIMQQFQASQIVSEEPPDTKRLKLRLLPRPIDYYEPQGPESNGAIFLFVAGRMPGIIVFLETDGMGWQYGIGRLSAPSTLVVTVNGLEVYRVPPNFGTWSGSYNASNSSVKIPGIEELP